VCLINRYVLGITDPEVNKTSFQTKDRGVLTATDAMLCYRLGADLVNKSKRMLQKEKAQLAPGWGEMLFSNLPAIGGKEGGELI
jgi:hypothetical protein